MSPPEIRKIIHIDMDAFFASVEQRDDPSLKGKPIAVGGGGTRGVVASASYEARKYGVKSAMPGILARKKCPQIIFVQGNFEKYKAVSKVILDIFHEFTDIVEPLSLDEAFLDVTHNKRSLPSATLIAMEIRERIAEKTGLTASAGVSYNKFLAKVASDINKPDGIKIITPSEGHDFLKQLPISRFHGIGKITAERCKRLGIYIGEDLLRWTQQDLTKVFGKAGAHYYQIVRGNDSRLVNPVRSRKSIGKEKTFMEDCRDFSYLTSVLESLCIKIFRMMKKDDNFGKTITIKIKHSNFIPETKSKTYLSELNDYPLFYTLAEGLMKELVGLDFCVRLLGISVSTLKKEQTMAGVQLTLDF
jgi:DNA polymerase-4